MVQKLLSYETAMEIRPRASAWSDETILKTICVNEAMTPGAWRNRVLTRHIMDGGIACVSLRWLRFM
jgi:hypothetical protein